MFDESKIGNQENEAGQPAVKEGTGSAPAEESKNKTPISRVPYEVRRKVLESTLQGANDSGDMYRENTIREMIKELEAQAGKASSLGSERVSAPKKQSKEIEKLRNETRINVLNLYLEDLAERRPAAKGEEMANIEEEEQYIKSEIEKEEQKGKGVQDKSPMEGDGSISGT